MLFLLSVIFGLAFYFLFLQTRLAKNKLEDRKFKQQSIEIKNDRKGETAIRRNPSSERGLLKVNISGVDTLYKNFQLGVKNYGSSPCLGQRFMQGPFTWLTYNEVNERVTNLGSGMKNKGIKRGENIGIYSINRPEWVIVEQACNAYSFVLVPLYDTLGPNAVEFIINQSGLTTVFVTKDKLELLLKSQPNCPSLKNIVLIDNNTIEDNCNGLINSLKDLEENGKNEPQKHDPPSPDDMATICYTSGTTGDPKGVILLHKNFLAAASGANVSGIEITHADVHISYLPLPHVFERIVQVLMFPNGCRVGFFRGDVRQLFDDILILKPTIFPSVPRLFNRLYDKVTQAIKSTGGIKEKLFNLAFNEKKIYLRKGYFKHPVWDKLVFDKIRARLGGRVRLMITGSAPISSDVLDFLRICFSCDVIEGYGQTEGTAAATTTMLGDTVTGHCGSPNPSVEIKLVDVAEMEYFSTDNPPRGEILVRGPSQFIGYYKNEEQTKSTIEDGWVHTGDIGTFLPNGTLKVIDRKKNIFKLSIGEYVAPEKIENVYNKVDLVAQSFVYGDSLKGSLVAVVVPDEEVIVPYCKKNGIEGSFSELCKNVQIKELISKSLVDAAKEAKLKSFEQVRDIFISSTLFSVDNEILTPTFKLKRPQAYKAYKEQIENLLSKLD